MNAFVLFCGAVSMVAMSFDGSPWPPEGAAGMVLLWLSLSAHINKSK